MGMGLEMAPDHIQALVDADEADVAARYERRRRLADVLEDAARRADAMSRLEAWLRYRLGPPRSAS
jgi:hypothetical protein